MNVDTVGRKPRVPHGNNHIVQVCLLLLQAVSIRVTGNELLVPNDQNIDLSFQGTEWNKGKALAIANGLIEKGLLFKKPVAGGKMEYCVVSAGPSVDIGPIRKKVIDETKTLCMSTLRFSWAE